jgi:ribonuclease R
MTKKNKHKPHGVRKRILGVMQEETYRPLKQHEIAAVLGLVEAERPDLRSQLKQMASEGIVELLKGNRWALPRPAELLEGRLHMTDKGFGFVIHDSEDLPDTFIPKPYIGAAMHMDRVQVSKLEEKNSKPGKTAGKVVQVLERHFKRIPGLLIRDGKRWAVVPDHPLLNHHFRVKEFLGDSEPTAFSKVLLEPDHVQNDPYRPQGKVIEILGPADQPGMDMISLLHERQIAVEFDADVEAEAVCPERMADGLSDSSRVDARDEICYTIDPVDAKDHDDAVSAVMLENGELRVGIHIADVSHFVGRNSAIDKEAYQRATSTYLVDRVIPMLPNLLTTDVCSLIPDVDRLAFSVWIHLDEAGDIVHHEISPSIIRSRGRLNYGLVHEFIQGKKESVPEKGRESIEHLHRMSRILRAARMANGSVDFNMPEIRCVLDDQGDPVRMEKRESNEAYQLIEEYMLLANRVVAKTLHTAGYPSLFRVHPEPDQDDWVRMSEDLMKVGVSAAPFSADDLNRITREHRGEPYEFGVSLAMLRNMKQAYYSAKRSIHFGLNFEDYVHFTSPIRRYPDLVVHRVLRSLLRKKPSSYSSQVLEPIARHCSEQERNAEAAEKESLTIKRLQYFEDLLEKGEREPYRAVITKIKAPGMVVELVDSLQSGFLPYASFTGEYVKVDMDRGFAFNQASKTQYKMGDLIDVGITSIDAGKRQAEFYPCGGEATSRTPKKATEKTKSRQPPRKEKSITSKRKRSRRGKRKKSRE